MKTEKERRNWKNDLAGVCFRWLMLSVADKPEGETDEKWRIQTEGYKFALGLIAKPFSWNGYIGIPLSLCIDDTEPVIQGEKPGIKMKPEAILDYIEDTLKSEIYRLRDDPEGKDYEPILYNCVVAIKQIRQDCFCRHFWQRSQFDEIVKNEDGTTVAIPVYVCIHCNAERYAEGDEIESKDLDQEEQHRLEVD